ncbi:MAG: FRG domain-containing protein [Aquabacterium sp.]
MKLDIGSNEIGSLSAFVEYCETIGLVSHTVLFRGQDLQGRLLPGIARANPRRDTVEVERSMLRQFRSQGASLLNGGYLLELELLVLAQHHGLKTRLLDWTTNPLTALWFACSSVSEGDVYVYVLDSDASQTDDIYRQDPFTHESTCVFQPRFDNPRVLAQNGWFTLHRYSQKSKCFIPLEKQKELGGHLHELVIPKNARSSIVYGLSRMGVHPRSLFPDLNGLAQHLNLSHRV